MIPRLLNSEYCRLSALINRWYKTEAKNFSFSFAADEITNAGSEY